MVDRDLGPGAPGEALTLLRGQGDWTLAEGLLVIHSASPGPSGAHVGLWAQQLPSMGPGHGSGSCLMGKRAVPSPRGKCPPLGRLPGWVSSFLLHIPLGGHRACSCVCMCVLSGPDTSLEDLCFCLCLGAISIPCPSGLG